MRYDKKDTNKWVIFPKKTVCDLGRCLGFVISHLAIRGLL